MARSLTRKLLGGALAAVAVVVGLDALADATQTRPDPRAPRSRSEVVMRVRTRDPDASKRFAAEGLWGACQGTARRRVVEPGMQQVGDATFRIVVEPGLGRHARDRLTGCLEDLTIEEVQADVLRMGDAGPARQSP